MTDFPPKALAAPAPGFKLVDRYIPAPYRRALYDKKTPMAVITRAYRDTLNRAIFDLEQVQKSRSVNFFSDLDDGTALGAIHAQKPWPEESIEAFRVRLHGITVLALQGAASAHRMLSLIALATGSELIESYGFNSDDSTYSKTYSGITMSGQIALGQYRGLFAKPNGGAVFTADVLDAPLRPYRQPAMLLPQPQYIFELNNQAFKSIPDIIGNTDRRYPDPIFDIETDQPFGPFLLVQVDPARLNHAPRVIVVNRKLRAGSKLSIDIAAMRWSHTNSPEKTNLAWITVNGKKGSLYAGLSEIASAQSLFDNESITAPAAGYAMDIRLPAELVWTGLLVDQMVDKGSISQSEKIKMPALLSDGKTRWHLLEVNKPTGVNQTDIQNADFNPVRASSNIRITARWQGRRAGEFALRFDERMLAPDQSGPLAYRVKWLDEMVARFKLAGTVRIPEIPLIESEIWAFSEAELEQPEVQLDLLSSLLASDEFELDDGSKFKSDVMMSDSFELLRQSNFILESNTVLLDKLTISNVSPDGSISSDTIASDSFSLHPQVKVNIRANLPLADEFLLENTGPVLDIRSDVKLWTRWEILPQNSANLSSSTKLSDSLTVIPQPIRSQRTITMTFRSHVTTKDALKIEF